MVVVLECKRCGVKIERKRAWVNPICKSCCKERATARQKLWWKNPENLAKVYSARKSKLSDNPGARKIRSDYYKNWSQANAEKLKTYQKKWLAKAGNREIKVEGSRRWRARPANLAKTKSQLYTERKRASASLIRSARLVAESMQLLRRLIDDQQS